MSLAKRIIFISRKKFPIQKIQCYFALEYKEEYDIQIFSDYAGAENILLDPEYTLSLLVADFRNADLFQDIQILKNDEFFRFLSVLGIVTEINESTFSQLLQCGCEHYIDERYLQKYLIQYMQAILLRSNYITEISLQVSQLQEKAIHDFILHDLIKSYIPRTIWHKADEFAEEQKLVINSEETELVICFADICQFSTLSQYKKPKEVVDMLNVVFEVATRYIFYFCGDVDKFIGDAVLAIFNNVEQAIKAVYGIQKEIYELNYGKDLEEVVQFRMGIHTGRVIRGNVGGNRRYDNTLIGDAVNVASRLEGKSPNGGFVISQAVCDRLGLDIPEEYRDSAELKGRQNEETYYSMLDYLNQHPDVIPNLLGDIEIVQKMKGKKNI